MRELKFRVWNGYQFATSTDVYIKSCDGSLWVWDHDDGCLWSADAKIQQFTGLKDKNGVEIYEGDIIKMLDGTIYEVKFHIEDNELKCSGYMFSSFGSEVIGNIFEF